MQHTNEHLAHTTGIRWPVPATQQPATDVVR